MIQNAFATQKRYSKNLKKIIPVVASTFVLNNSAYAAPEGISELIEITHRLLPEGIKAAKYDISTFILNRKRAMAHGLVGVATSGAVIVGAVPIAFSDAAILVPVEIAMVNALAQIYGIDKNEESKKFLKRIIEVGTVGVAAKQAINVLKAIPGVNIGASLVNAIIAGSIVAAIGEGSIYAFEQIYLGKKSVSDVEWIEKEIESKLSNQFIDRVIVAFGDLTKKSDNKQIAKVILDLFAPLNENTQQETKGGFDEH